MDFRWIVGITLWTVLVGPVFGPPSPAVKDTAVTAAPDSSTPRNAK